MHNCQELIRANIQWFVSKKLKHCHGQERNILNFAKLSKIEFCGSDN